MEFESHVSRVIESESYVNELGVRYKSSSDFLFFLLLLVRV